MKQIAKEGIRWEKDPDWGYEVPKEVPGDRPREVRPAPPLLGRGVRRARRQAPRRAARVAGEVPGAGSGDSEGGRESLESRVEGSSVGALGRRNPRPSTSTRLTLRGTLLSPSDSPRPPPRSPPARRCPVSSTYARLEWRSAALAFCSTSRTGTPARWISSIASKIAWTTIGARPSDGSSSSRTRGLDISARPIASICCSPPESVPGRLLEPLLQPREERVDLLVVRREPAESRRAYAPISRFSRTREVGEDDAALGHEDEAVAHEPVRRRRRASARRGSGPRRRRAARGP